MASSFVLLAFEKTDSSVLSTLTRVRHFEGLVGRSAGPFRRTNRQALGAFVRAREDCFGQPFAERRIVAVLLEQLAVWSFTEFLLQETPVPYCLSPAMT